jgi:adenosylcobinamide kinase / adenosylcobinamide-phosphate guanylyltransferase
MARIVLVTGGCRSGKSAYAQLMAESLPPPRLYVATCPVTDDEMERRIEQHRQARHDRGWETIEEQLDLAGVFRRCTEYTHVKGDSPIFADTKIGTVANVVLVDCVTLWINNLMYQAATCGAGVSPARAAGTAAPQYGQPLTEADVAARCSQMLAAAETCCGTVIFVTNEVGLGVVPDNAQARSYRDLIGRVNQTIAARADAVTLVCCGIPLHLKERRS